MAAKRAKKKAAVAMKKEEACACCPPAAGMADIQDWLLIFLGALGIAFALGYIDWPGFGGYFPYVWSILVLVIGAKNLMNKNCECCK